MIIIDPSSKKNASQYMVYSEGAWKKFTPGLIPKTYHFTTTSFGSKYRLLPTVHVCILTYLITHI